MTTTSDEKAVAALLAGGPSVCDLGGVERSFGIVGCGRDQDTWTVARFGPWMTARPGLEHPGAVAVLLDHCLGETIFIGRPAGSWSLTTELGFDVLVPPPWDLGVAFARARMSRAESTGGFAEGEILAEDGTVLVRATTWARYVAVDGGPDTTLPPPRRVAAGAPPAAGSLAEHLGYRVERSADTGTVDTATVDTATVVLPDAGRWNNDYGVLHGGVWATVAEVASSAALTDGGPDLTTAHVQVSYLRRAAPGEVVLTARPRHRGRTFAEVAVLGTDAEGRICVSATVTARRPG